MEFIVLKIEINIREFEGVFNKIFVYLKFMVFDKEIILEFVEKVLKEFIDINIKKEFIIEDI